MYTYYILGKKLPDTYTDINITIVFTIQKITNIRRSNFQSIKDIKIR